MVISQRGISHTHTHARMGTEIALSHNGCLHCYTMYALSHNGWSLPEDHEQNISSTIDDNLTSYKMLHAARIERFNQQIEKVTQVLFKFLLYCAGEEPLNAQIRCSKDVDVTFSNVTFSDIKRDDNTTDDEDDESPSQRTEMTDDEEGEDDQENQQDLGNVDITTTTIENLQMKEKGINTIFSLLKLMWGEFVDAFVSYKKIKEEDNGG